MTAATASSTARTVVTVVMDILVAVVVALVVHLVISFFGQFSSAAWGSGVVKVTRLAVIPMGFPPVQTPYGGAFDVNAAATSLALLVIEWVLGLVRRSV
jgi:hypothetical protein